MNADLDETARMSMATTVAPEDLSCGDYVAVLNEVIEIPGCCWFDLPSQHPPEEPIRVRMMTFDSGTPLKVQAICLPFVYARYPDGRSEAFDIRRVQFVQVSRAYARCAWKAARKELARRRRECR